jgi:hypothetical protein
MRRLGRGIWVLLAFAVTMAMGLFGNQGSAVAYNQLLDTNFKCATANSTDWWCTPSTMTIRVKRMAKQGQPIETWGLDYWMANTLPNEINCDPNSYDAFHTQTIDATALALKMYGWARNLKYEWGSPTTLRSTRDYDVTDDTSDGARFIEGSANAMCDAAISRVANEMIVRNYSGSANGTIFETTWKRGTTAPPTPSMQNSDDFQQRNAEYEYDTNIWSTRNQALTYFYAYFRVQYHL